MENSHISWTTHTFNPWIGCTKVSPGCANCYAETLMDTRYGKVKWGKGQPRVRTAPANWKKVRQWDREAAKTGIRPRVFCASLSDWLDDEVPIEWLADLLALIVETPNLDWLLLTKRPQNWNDRVTRAAYHASGFRDYPNGENPVAAALPGAEQMRDWVQRGIAPANVWIGTTIEDQERARIRLPQIMDIPARIRFLSCEPLLGPVDLFDACFSEPGDEVHFGVNSGPALRFGVDWVIVGGESGHGARKMEAAWARSLRDQCQSCHVAFHFKQWGEINEAGEKVGKAQAGRLLDGREWNELPTQLAEVRE